MNLARGSKTGKVVLFALMVGLLFFPRLFSSAAEVGDPFANVNVALAQMALERNQLIIYPFRNVPETLQDQANTVSEKIGATCILIVMSETTGLPITSMQFVPIIGIALLVIAYALARLLLGSRILALACALFVAYEPIITRLTNSLYYISLGLTLSLVFAVLLFRTVSGSFKRSGVLLMLITFVAIYFSYYTAEAYAIAMLGMVTFLVSIAGYTRRIILERAYPDLHNLCIALVAIVMIFEAMFVYLFPEVNMSATTNFLQDFIVRVISRLLSLPVSEKSILYRYSLIQAFLEVAVFLALVIPTLVYLLQLVVNSLKSREVKLDARLLLFFAILSPQLLFLFYASFGLFDQKWVMLAFPMLAFYSISRFRLTRRAKAAFMMVILVLCMSKFVLYASSVEIGHATNYYTYTSPGVRWLSQFGTTNVLTDLKTGEMLLARSVYTRTIDGVLIWPFSRDNVGFLYSPPPSSCGLPATQPYSYLMLSYQSINSPLVGGYWDSFKPLKGGFIQLNGCPGLLKIYDDAHSAVWMAT